MSDNSGDLVSVVITNYNYGAFISKSVKSVINQTYKHIELLIIDDYSSDNSREIITELKKNMRRMF